MVAKFAMFRHHHQSRQKVKVAFIHNIISPLNVPLFAELAKDRKIDINFIFLSASDPNRPWKAKTDYSFKYAVLPGIRLIFKGKDVFPFYFNPGIWGQLKKGDYDVILISGWDHPTYWLAALFARLHRKKLVLWSGSTKYESSWRRTLSLPLVKLIVSWATAYIAYGTRSKDYLISLGASSDKIAIAYNTTDLKPYARAVMLRNKQQYRLKKQF